MRNLKLILDSILYDVIKYFRSLPDDVLNPLTVEALSWGLCCGDLKLAYRAITLFIKIVKSFDINATIDKSLRVLYIVSQCYYEKTNNLAKAKKNQWLYHMIDKNDEVDHEATILYMSSILDLLTKCIELSKEPHVMTIGIISFSS